MAEGGGGKEEGIILNSGYLTQGEHHTVEGGITVLFPKHGKRYAVLQNTGPAQFNIQLYKDEKNFLKKDKKNAKVLKEYNFTANISIHSLEMTIGKSRKPQSIFIIVHGGMPLYFKPADGAAMNNWVEGFQKVSNAISRRATLSKSQQKNATDTNDQDHKDEPANDSGDKDDTTNEEEDGTNNRDKQKTRLHEDSGIESTPPTSRRSIPSTTDNNPEEASEETAASILPQVIEMDLPDKEGNGETANTTSSDDVDSPCRRSRMVLNKGHYEEQYVGATPKLNPTSALNQSVTKFQAIKEEGGPREQDRDTLSAIPEIRKNIVTMRLSTWPNRPPSGTDPATEPPYQKSLLRTERQPSEPEGVEGFSPEEVPASPLKSRSSIAKWKTTELVKVISKQLENRPPGIPPKTKRNPTRPRRESEIDEEEEGVVDPPYDRLSKYQNKLAKSEEEVEEEMEKVEEEEETKRRNSLDSLPEEDRPRVFTNPHIDKRPLPTPNKETNWKDVGNMVYEQSCRSIKVSMEKEEVLDTLALINSHDTVWIAGWKKDYSEKLYGKLHVGDGLAQINDQVVTDADVAQTFIRSSAKSEMFFHLKRLPHANIRELHKSKDASSWGLEMKTNEIKDVTGPALEGGLTPKTTGAFTNKQVEWVVTEVEHQRMPIANANKEVKQRLEKLSEETKLVLVLQPKDFISELRSGLNKLKHSSQYYV